MSIRIHWITIVSILISVVGIVLFVFFHSPFLLFTLFFPPFLIKRSKAIPYCPTCLMEILHGWEYCPNCGEHLLDIDDSPGDYFQ